MSWLKQVQQAEDRVPDWLARVFDHPMFLGLDRQTHSVERGWRIITREEFEFEGETLHEASERFSKHYRIPQRP
jgi:hypothetical protein